MNEVTWRVEFVRYTTLSQNMTLQLCQWWLLDNLYYTWLCCSQFINGFRLPWPNRRHQIFQLLIPVLPATSICYTKIDKFSYLYSCVAKNSYLALGLVDFTFVSSVPCYITLQLNSKGWQYLHWLLMGCWNIVKAFR